MYRAGDARFRRLLMNKLQLTKGELTKIILEEVRNLQEQDEDLNKAANNAAKAEIEKRLAADENLAPKLLAVLKEMDNYE